MIELLKSYARQPSTWRGLALLLSAFGVVVDPGLIERVGVGVVGLIGLAEVVKNEGR